MRRNSFSQLIGKAMEISSPDFLFFILATHPNRKLTAPQATHYLQLLANSKACRLNQDHCGKTLNVFAERYQRLIEQNPNLQKQVDDIADMSHPTGPWNCS